jgi:hypothetical protein
MRTGGRNTFQVSSLRVFGVRRAPFVDVTVVSGRMRTGEVSLAGRAGRIFQIEGRRRRGGIRTRDLSLAGRAQGALSRLVGAK